MNPPKVALVIPAFNETPVLPELFARPDGVFAGRPDVAWSVILIDDGSRDATAAMIAAQCGRDPRYRMLGL